jgi:hypothetical protein
MLKLNSSNSDERIAIRHGGQAATMLRSEQMLVSKKAAS